MTTFNFLCIERSTVPHLLLERAEEIPNREFARQGGRSVTYGETELLANRVACGFRELGVKKNENVCLLLDNSLDFFSLWFGLNKLGAIEFPINTAFKGMLLEYILSYSDCRILVVGSNYLPVLSQISLEQTKLSTLVVCGETAAKDSFPTLQHLNWVAFDSLQANPDDFILEEIHYWEPMCIMSTSGTTGPSKGVLLSHNHEIVLAREYLRSLRYGPDDVHYNCLPLFHNIGQAFCTLPAMLAGGSIVVTDRFSASNFWSDIVVNQCTAFNFLGSMMTILCKQPPSPLDRAHRVRSAFGLPRPAGVCEEFEQRFGVTVIEGYGQTEANVVTYLPWEDRRPGSCGKVLPIFEVQLVDEQDQEVPLGEVGEFVVRTREPFTTTLGYYKMPEATATAMRNLWWHTGDVGRKDADGFFSFVDRKKDVIRRRGENISSYELETVVNSYPAVLESAAVAVPSELSEDDVLVAIVLKPEAAVSPEELLAYCKDNLPYYAVPRYFTFVAELPKTANGKVQKIALRGKEVVGQAWEAPQVRRG